MLDLAGKKFNRLTVLRFFDIYKKNGNARWLCQCDCGGKQTVVSGSVLVKGKIKSCGCLQKEVVDKIRQTKKYKDKMSSVKIGVAQPLGTKAGANELNHKAKIWVISKNGVFYKFTNLAKFIRENANLFDEEDLIPYKSRKDKCRARVMIQNLYLINSRNGELSVPSGQWKGWKPEEKWLKPDATITTYTTTTQPSTASNSNKQNGVGLSGIRQ